jgi:hypothetical protein
MNVRFAVCVDNSEYPASLDVHKVYRVVPDPEAEQAGDLRIIDERGEDYLYPNGCFLIMDLPRETELTLMQSFEAM